MNAIKVCMLKDKWTECEIAPILCRLAQGEKLMKSAGHNSFKHRLIAMEKFKVLELCR